MKFVVSSTPVTDTSRVPSTLHTVPFPPAGHTTVDHSFRFHRSGGEWKINDVGFADAANRVLAKVPRGAVEIWELEKYVTPQGKVSMCHTWSCCTSPNSYGFKLTSYLRV